MWTSPLQDVKLVLTDITDKEYQADHTSETRHLLPFQKVLRAESSKWCLAFRDFKDSWQLDHIDVWHQRFLLF